MSYRVGLGYDIHRLVEGRDLVLGGVKIEYEKGLLGHSDGDALVHAVCDALLGACAFTDIGELFPDTSPQTEGMYSLDMLEEIVSKLSPKYRVVNIDVNCICERPRLAAYRNKMVANIAQTCKIDTSLVSVKFRTNEGLGETGAGEAIAAQAVVLVEVQTSDKEYAS
ncbi:MAG TPA: 2-C-methyl-D-erythritol 2,4-cyclodiphosphate synthase [Deltaproteobacteria bacterium]|jgi:2-C-methyl-D-erythritol 2,4-cyclodiphosphate synthase|nr:2-C-methyl-D-erythritol 2,4-cyclodiphosphate synthase [Deltaproteobacteria bacterium]HQJ07493.1 2-C-methyl-D-erythritol 2,4-cyclodiphosphate synthase [Deltaproteobacteria bacterium]